MLVKNVVSPLNSFKCSAYQLVDQNWHKMQSQNTYFVNIFCVARPQTPMLCKLIVVHTMPFSVTSFKGLIHYYVLYATGFHNFLNRNSQYTSYKFIIQALNLQQLSYFRIVFLVSLLYVAVINLYSIFKLKFCLKYIHNNVHLFSIEKYVHILFLQLTKFTVFFIFNWEILDRTSSTRVTNKWNWIALIILVVAVAMCE